LLHEENGGVILANLLYLIALAAGSPVILYRMIRHGRYRRGVREKLFGLSADRADLVRPDGAGRLIWLHAVSVGEVNLLTTLVRRILRAAPETRIVVSTSTDTGYDLAVQNFTARRVFFCPLDFSWAVRRTLRNLRPDQLVLAELELWPNLIRAAGDSGCRVMVANARLSQRSAARYQSFGWLLRSTFERLDWVGCQDDSTARRFAACGCGNTVVTGSLKFDGAPNTRDDVHVQRLADWSRVDPWHRVWCFGSSAAGEETIALKAYQQLTSVHPELRLILVPRHRERFDAVAGLIEAAGMRARRRSRADDGVTQWPADVVVLVDTIGELRHWWGVAGIATVGGSFGTRGGQNMLEPAGYGCAVSFGPDTRNFANIADRLLDAGGAVRVNDAAELTRFVRRCLDEPPAADALGRSARTFVQSHQGATARTVDALLGEPDAGGRVPADEDS